jgi:hypothetical protein
MTEIAEISALRLEIERVKKKKKEVEGELSSIRRNIELGFIPIRVRKDPGFRELLASEIVGCIRNKSEESYCDPVAGKLYYKVNGQDAARKLPNNWRIVPILDLILEDTELRLSKDDWGDDEKTIIAFCQAQILDEIHINL